MTLGQKLKKLRTEKGLTQKDLARQLHVTFQTVSKWESDINEPDIATLKELSRLYNCSYNYLLSEEIEEPKEKAVSETTAIPVPTEVIEKTIIVHKNEAHVCAKCGKDINEEDLVSVDNRHTVRRGRHTRTVSYGQTKSPEYDIEGIRIIDIADWLLNNK